VQHSEQVQQDDDANWHAEQPKQEIATHLELPNCTSEERSQITLKMFIRMITLIGTPISHSSTLRIFFNSVLSVGRPINSPRTQEFRRLARPRHRRWRYFSSAGKTAIASRDSNPPAISIFENGAAAAICLAVMSIWPMRVDS
jgi:hypothetical protein